MDCHPLWGLFHGEPLLGIHKSNGFSITAFYAAPLAVILGSLARIVIIPVGDSQGDPDVAFDFLLRPPWRFWVWRFMAYLFSGRLSRQFLTSAPPVHICARVTTFTSSGCYYVERSASAEVSSTFRTISRWSVWSADHATYVERYGAYAYSAVCIGRRTI